MSNDPNEFSALTPGHCLIGDSMISLPQEDIVIKSNQRFKLLQNMYRDFWKSWKRDYLTELKFAENSSLTVHSLHYVTWFYSLKTMSHLLFGKLVELSNFF